MVACSMTEECEWTRGPSVRGNRIAPCVCTYNDVRASRLIMKYCGAIGRGPPPAPIHRPRAPICHACVTSPNLPPLLPALWPRIPNTGPNRWFAREPRLATFFLSPPTFSTKFYYRRSFRPNIRNYRGLATYLVAPAQIFI